MEEDHCQLNRVSVHLTASFSGLFCWIERNLYLFFFYFFVLYGCILCIFPFFAFDKGRLFFIFASLQRWILSKTFYYHKYTQGELKMAWLLSIVVAVNVLI